MAVRRWSWFSRPNTIRRIEQFDPMAVFFVVHGLVLLVGGEVERPAEVGALIAALALVRFGFGWGMARRLKPTEFTVRTVLTVALVAAVLIADGGTESPFFFWMILLLAWQALIFDHRRFLRLGGVMGAAYVVVILVADDVTAASLARMGLFAALFGVLLVGRLFLDSQGAEIRRLDGLVGALVEESPLGLAVFDSNRDTLLYSNEAAHEMGIDAHDGMARLIPVGGQRGEGITTLAGLVVGAGYGRSSPRAFYPIAEPETRYLIGYHLYRAPDSEPVVMVYGHELSAEEEDSPRPG